MFEPIKEATTPQEMRAVLNELRRHDPIVRNVMDMADYQGLSAEDRYTVLSYYLMQSMRQSQKAIHDYVLTMPSPPMIIMKTEPIRKLCQNKVNGVCQQHNLHCGFPDCER